MFTQRANHRVPFINELASAWISTTNLSKYAIFFYFVCFPLPRRLGNALVLQDEVLSVGFPLPTTRLFSL